MPTIRTIKNRIRTFFTSEPFQNTRPEEPLTLRRWSHRVIELEKNIYPDTDLTATNNQEKVF